MGAFVDAGFDVCGGLVGPGVPLQTQSASDGHAAFLQRPTDVLQNRSLLQFTLLPQVPPQELGCPEG